MLWWSLPLMLRGSNPPKSESKAEPRAEAGACQDTRVALHTGGAVGSWRGARTFERRGAGRISLKMRLRAACFSQLHLSNLQSKASHSPTPTKALGSLDSCRPCSCLHGCSVSAGAASIAYGGDKFAHPLRLLPEHALGTFSIDSGGLFWLPF